jgi:peptidoglycan/xylan/chitin deacetylase (PgdA/CDA1 family)
MEKRAMMIQEGDGSEPAGLRERVGEFFYASGLLKPLRKLRAVLRKDLRILAYHRVVDLADPCAFEFDLELISADSNGFREQMLLLKQHFQPMRLGDVIAARDSGVRLPGNAVVVTFDDGYDDNYKVAYPILRELGVPATFFVSTGHIDSGRPFAYDWLVHMILLAKVKRLVLPELNLDAPIPPGRTARRHFAANVLRHIKAFDGALQMAAITRMEHEWQMPRTAATAGCQPMTWDQLREMHASGFEIGSHGVSHQMLAKLPDEQVHDELKQSRATLERELGAPATLLAYPVGGDHAFDRRVLAATEAAGYSAACSYIYGTNPGSGWNRYSLNRLPVERVMGTGWFAAMLTLPELMGYSIKNLKAEIAD